ncbi:MAG: acyl-CoA thioesterase [Actinomycetes bacterium]
MTEMEKAVEGRRPSSQGSTGEASTTSPPTGRDAQAGQGVDVARLGPESKARLRGLLEVLALRAEGVDDRGQDVFVGQSQRQVHGRVFGGQVLGQTVIAAGRTVPVDRLVHSMHAYFLRPGDANRPITFRVERLRDGRSFTARRVHAYQQEKTILSMTASFQELDPGLDHQDEMPDAPDPETLPTAYERIGHIDLSAAQYWARGRPLDIRHVQQPVYFTADTSGQSRQMVWMRTVGRLPDDQLLHRAVLAYASDYTLLESVLRRHGKMWTTPGLKPASIDHAMWWHRTVRADEWMLYVESSPSASGARGLGLGRIFRRDGTLVATVAQEGMLRVPLD